MPTYRQFTAAELRANAEAMKQPFPIDYESGDYYSFLRYKDYEDNERTRAAYARSKQRGKFTRLVNDRRWKQFSPGKFHATSITGIYLNRNFVKGSAAYTLANHQDKF